MNSRPFFARKKMMPCASNKKRHPLFFSAPCCLAGCRSRYCRRNYYCSLHPPTPSRPSKPICSLAKGNALSNCRKDKRIPVSPGLEPYGNDRSPENTSPLHPWPFRMQSKEWRYLFYKKRHGSQPQSNSVFTGTIPDCCSCQPSSRSINSLRSLGIL